jgi:N-acetylglucosamine-6-sulfatase
MRSRTNRVWVLLPASLVVLIMAALAGVLDRGVDQGLSGDLIEFSGLVYFGLLMGAPLILYPFAWRAGLARSARFALALSPSLLWWGTEVGFRLETHTLAEAIWLSTSPFNTFHFAILLTGLGLSDWICRLVSSRTGREVGRTRWTRLALVLAGLPVGLALSLGWVPAFLFGYYGLFQDGLLPIPTTRPGPMADGEAVPLPGNAVRPNIVFILSDDHRADFAGYAGHPFIETPALDRLASEGIRFDRAYVTSSLCSPSRASFLTGQTPHRHGVWNNFTPWSDENRTFFEYLAEAGYDTAFIGKWHMPGSLPELRGVDHFVSFTNLGGQGTYEWNPLVVDGREEESRTRYIATELTDRALEWLDARIADRVDTGSLDPDSKGRERPFALMLSHKSVHADFRPDEEERGRYREEAVELPEGAHSWTHQLNGQYAHMTYMPLADAVRVYGEAIASMDREIGRVLDWLDAEGLAHNTLVIYASDNGYMWGEHGRTDKRWAYEDSIRIPLLVRLPALGHPEGARSDAIVANFDVAPTLVELAGLERPAHMQGLSFVPLLRDPSPRPDSNPWRSNLFYSYYFEPPYPAPTVMALVTPRFKYVETNGRKPSLYDLASDPKESRDLIDDVDAQTLENLKRRFVEMQTEMSGIF